MVKLPPTKQAPTKAPPTKSPPTKSGLVKSAPAATALTPGEKYTFANLQTDVASKLPLVAKATVERVVLATFEEVSRNFLLGKVVNLKDFGKFEIKNRPERQGRNPATGETVKIEAKRVPKFTFAKKMKDVAK